MTTGQQARRQPRRPGLEPGPATAPDMKAAMSGTASQHREYLEAAARRTRQARISRAGKVCFPPGAQATGQAAHLLGHVIADADAAYRAAVGEPRAARAARAGLPWAILPGGQACTRLLPDHGTYLSVTESSRYPGRWQWQRIPDPAAGTPAGAVIAGQDGFLTAGAAAGAASREADRQIAAETAQCPRCTPARTTPATAAGGWP